MNHFFYFASADEFIIAIFIYYNYFVATVFINFIISIIITVDYYFQRTTQYSSEYPEDYYCIENHTIITRIDNARVTIKIVSARTNNLNYFNTILIQHLNHSPIIIISPVIIRSTYYYYSVFNYYCYICYLLHIPLPILLLIYIMDAAN